MKEKRGNIYVCSESRKATKRKPKYLLGVYQQTISINLPTKEVERWTLHEYMWSHKDIHQFISHVSTTHHLHLGTIIQTVWIVCVKVLCLHQRKRWDFVADVGNISCHTTFRGKQFSQRAHRYPLPPQKNSNNQTN